MAKTDSQCKVIYELLLEGKSITNLGAITNYGIGRLASRICDLTQMYDVPVERVRERNADGEGFHTRYYMADEDRKRLKDVPLCEVFKHRIQAV